MLSHRSILVATVEASVSGNPDDVRFAASLREALGVAETAGAIGARVTHAELLQMIVEVGSHVLAHVAYPNRPVT